MELAVENLDETIDIALKEDIGAGDVTTLACVPSNLEGQAEIVCKSGGVLAGQTVAAQVCRRVDDSLTYAPLAADGSEIPAGTLVAGIAGRLASILTAERTALNFLMRLSGIATLTRKFVREIAGTETVILDTRKTTPGLRPIEKYAVLCGGGANHRMGLHDMLLIKDNHIRAAGSVSDALRKCLDYVEQTGRELPIEVEVRSSMELKEALDSGAVWIMLDNMTTGQIKAAVDTIRHRSSEIKIEVSGGVTLANVRKIAECSVDYISIGALTHSAPSLDFSLNVLKTKSL